MDKARLASLPPEGDQNEGRFFSATNLLFILILCAAAYLRMHKLNRLGMWFDELQTMLDVNPHLGWSGFFDELKNGDGVHPPLYFILGHFFAMLCGYTDWSLRLFSALTGVGAVGAMYFLGKEIKNKQLGVLSAAVIAFNYFCLYYSQEARMYSLLLFFTILSYLFFFRACNRLLIKDFFFFALFSSCAAYTHYFGLLVVASEVAIAAIFLLQGKTDRARLFLGMLISGLLVAVSYLPWLPHLKMTGGIHSFWIKPIAADFFVDYFNDYFGHYMPLINFAVAMIILFIINVLFHLDGFSASRKNPVNRAFVFVLISLLVSWGIPYARSVMVVPMLSNRYTIIALPPIAIAVAYGIHTLQSRLLQFLLLAYFVQLSVKSLVSGNHFYTRVYKAQFRDVASLVSATHNDLPLVCEETTRHLGFYLAQYGYKGNILNGKREDIIKKILSKSEPMYQVDSFWLTAAFIDAYPSKETQHSLDSQFTRIQEASLYNAWAQLYVRNDRFESEKTIDHQHFEPKATLVLKGDTVTAMWFSSIASDSLFLEKGNYIVVLEESGSPLKDIYPHDQVLINNQSLGTFIGTEEYSRHPFRYTQDRDRKISIVIKTNNDEYTKDEDRNTFIRKILILKER